MSQRYDPSFRHAIALEDSKKRHDTRRRVSEVTADRIPHQSTVVAVGVGVRLVNMMLLQNVESRLAIIRKRHLSQ